MSGGEDTPDGQTGSVRQSKGHPWAQLLRLPNLLTVPGDPIAGFMLACYAAGVSISVVPLIHVAVASVLLYAAGLIHNDLCDVETDGRQRPNRPLPSGRISMGAARLALVVLAVAALAAAVVAGWLAVATAAVLLAAILIYNRFTKGVALIGPINMGACRGLSFLLGAVAACGIGQISWSVRLSAVCLTLYIASVTAIAARETEAHKIGLKRWLPPLIVLLWMVGIDAMFLFLPILTVWIAAVQIVAVQWAMRCVYPLSGRPKPKKIQRAVGRLICVLLPIQAAIVATAATAGESLGGWITAWVLLATWPVAAILAKRFHAS